MIYVGTCSWTDPTLLNESSFYPARSMTAEERLRFYAGKFNTVEVDSSFYALPAESVVNLQVQRTPPGFILHYKAFGLLTGHGVAPVRLPRPLRELFDPARLAAPHLSDREVPEEARRLSFRMFAGAMRPAQAAQKLGCLLFQFPPWFKPETKSFDYLERCRAELPEFRLAVEFRQPDWMSPSREAETLRFLADQDLAYVSVDEPQFDPPTTVPPLYRATTSTVYVRLHGRNKANWNKRGLTPAQRFAYDYSQDELFDISGYIRSLASQTDNAFVMFNNCFRDYAVNNAMIMSEILRD
jgi:uncharacterized protein YecE (DUF72 family)